MSCASSPTAARRLGGAGRGVRSGVARPGGQHIVEQLARALIARVNLRRHRLEHDVVDRFRDLRVLEPRRREQLALHQPIEVSRRRRVVGQLPGQHLIHRHAERVDVGGEDRLAVKLLRRHVRRAADHGGAVRCDFEKPRGAEVGDLQHAAFGDEHVRRPQIPVQHALAVRVIHGVHDLAGVVERTGDVERPVSRDDRLERFARDELHHDEENVLLLLRGQDGDDVGMIEAGEQARLAQQLAEVDALLVGNLQGNLLVDPGVFREVNRSKTATANRRQNLVLSNDLTAEKHLCAVSHGSHRERVEP